MQEEKKMSECVVCKEAITNPICGFCVDAAVNEWLLQEGFEAIDLNIEFGEDSCILCKKDMAVCSYCHTKNVLDVLKEKIPQKKFEELLSFYHLDLDKKGYLEEYF